MASAELRPREIGVLAACFAVGALLRLRGVFTDFWLDEIWSLVGVRGVASPVEIVTRLHSDNNHILNSLWLYLLGERSGWYAYRLPALSSGVLAILAVWLVARRRGALAGSLATILFSTSHLMVLYGSEARGYAPMILFGLVALGAAPGVLHARTEGRRALAAAFFVAASVAGLLSHLLFVHVYTGIAAWSALAVFASPDRRARRLLIASHVSVLAAFGALWVAFIRHLPDPTGPVRSYADVLANALSVAFGGPEREDGGLAAVAAVAVAALVLAVVVAEVVLSLRDRTDTWLPLAVACFLAPGLTLLIVRPEVLFVRYFLVAILASYILVASFLARLARGRIAGRVACVVLVLLVLAGQARHLLTFHEHGRGGYLAAMRHVARHTTGSTATIATDHAFRNEMVVDYYDRFVPDVDLVVGPEVGSRAAPEWWVAHRFRGQPPPPPILYVGGTRYRRSAVFPHGSLSGWTWFVHRRWPTGNREGL